MSVGAAVAIVVLLEGLQDKGREGCGREWDERRAIWRGGYKCWHFKVGWAVGGSVQAAAVAFIGHQRKRIREIREAP